MRTLFVLALAITLGPATQAQTESMLHSFSGQPDGSIPSAGLVPDAQGNLYGTTYEGGASGRGTVFEVTPAGKETVLHSFTGGADGSGPASVLLRANGKLYGTTLVGGANSFGTVFELTSSAREAAVVSFTIEDGGGYPNAGLVQDTKGNLYGTNSGYNGGYGNGAVFKLTPTGVLTILYAFTGGTDGLCPYGGLILDPEGNLYGTTYRGGASG
jgi:uncharacterized repeat protein (TIGR03803 family)